MFYFYFSSFFVFYLFCMGFFVYLCLWSGFLLNLFFFTNLFDFSISFVFDFLSVGFFTCVSFISGFVFLYSVFYMEGVEDGRRFGLLVFLFVVSMFFLIFSGSFFLFLLGWDGLGLVSFCLVIYYHNSSSLESGLITVFSNRVGDCFFLLSFMFFYISGWFSWDVFFYCFFSWFSVFVFLGAITKSAQIPFSSWLPAAMAAPTPVSSLVHSSTLVTAGIYILIRYNYIFVFFNLSFFSVFSLFTMVLAGVGAFLEKDFKKIVAMSTLSQLGLMMYVISIGCWMFSFVHMIIHAFFKSMLFLSTGATMAQFSGGQDSRIFGGSFLMYISFLYFLVSCICLSGFPFFIGFYSKDFIINSSSFLSGVLSYYFFLFGCFFTILYSIRLLKNVYFAFLKFSVFFCFSESFIYVFSVLFLFFKGWSLGGFFYWFFMFENFYFFCYFDLLAGLLMIFLGVFFYSFLRFTYFLCVYFGSISFYLWLSSSKSSMSFMKYFFYNFDFGWLELMGGRGLFYSFSNFSIFFKPFSMSSVGLFFFCSLFIYFY